MKKIGIVTFHRATNYGAVLQSYSLISYLKKHICDATFEIVDYSTKSAQRSHTRAVLSYIRDLDFKSSLGELKKNAMFKRFSDNLPLSSYQIISDDIDEFNNYVNKEYDVVITGSDAIFSWNGKKFPTAYFLHDIKCPTLSYAASAHRLMFKEEPGERIEYAKEAFESLDYVGIRDKETERFVEYSKANVVIHHNCDPTFLLDIDDIHNRVDFNQIKKKCGIIDSKPVIVVMTPDSNVAHSIKEAFGRDYNLVSVFIDNKVLKPIVYDLTPFEWASLFSLARLTITEYFHATILSLLNSTPTLAIDKLVSNSGYEGKIRDLLYSRLEMPELYINVAELSNHDYSTVLERAKGLLSSFDYEKLNNNIAKEKSNVDGFLQVLNDIIK